MQDCEISRIVCPPHVYLLAQWVACDALAEVGIRCLLKDF